MEMSGKIPVSDDKEAKRLIIEVGKRMYDKDYCAANDGNISCRTEDDALGDAFRRFPRDL